MEVYDHYFECKEILKSREKTIPIPDESIISKYRTEEYDKDFIETMNTINPSETDTVYSLLINGNCNANVNKHISTLIIIGNIEKKCTLSSERVYHISTKNVDDALIEILERQSQKDWKTGGEIISGKTSAFNISRTALIMKVFSYMLKNFRKLDDERFVKACRKILFFSKELTEQKDK